MQSLFVSIMRVFVVLKLQMNSTILKKRRNNLFRPQLVFTLNGGRADLVDCIRQVCFSFAGDPSLPVTLCCHGNVRGVLILYMIV